MAPKKNIENFLESLNAEARLETGRTLQQVQEAQALSDQLQVKSEAHAIGKVVQDAMEIFIELAIFNQQAHRVPTINNSRRYLQ